MIEVKLSFTSVTELLGFFGAQPMRVLTEADAAADLAGTPRPDNATVAPGKGKSATDKPAATVKPTAKTADAAPKTPPPASDAITYEQVGAAINAAIVDPSNKPAVKALLGEFDAKDGNGKATNGQKLKPEDYAAFMGKLAKIGNAVPEEEALG